jgi:hypothetical protein
MLAAEFRWQQGWAGNIDVTRALTGLWKRD